MYKNSLSKSKLTIIEISNHTMKTLFDGENYILQDDDVSACGKQICFHVLYYSEVSF